MVGNGSGRTCLWGGPRGRGGGVGRGFTNATCVVAAQSPSGFIISSLRPSVREPKSGEGPQRRSDGSAAERSSSFWKKDRTRAVHSAAISPPQQPRYRHPPVHPPQIPVGWNVLTPAAKTAPLPVFTPEDHNQTKVGSSKKTLGTRSERRPPPGRPFPHLLGLNPKRTCCVFS